MFKKEGDFMVFNKEKEFEDAFIKVLQDHGWGEVIEYPKEQDLIDNWRHILEKNNVGRDILNDQSLIPSEMAQIMSQIRELKTPLALNAFINGKSVTIIRENPLDKNNYGKAVSLSIYDRDEIAAGRSRYQIVRQPQFKRNAEIANDYRGDISLLINGMPVIHIELKRTGVDITHAQRQIEAYSKDGVFSGLFSLVQVFVAMSPEDNVYFANPGRDGIFNSNYYFHWADVNNIALTNWKEFTSALLSIPMAHQLIGFYTVADKREGILKVMRSYQYYASSKIASIVAKHNWQGKNHRGGFIWHTTGAGKTITSFKSAQLVANAKNADKVIFLVDRKELADQSFEEYSGFADVNQKVQATEDTAVLISKLKSKSNDDKLIITSIQKMSRIKDDGCRSADIEQIYKNNKRIVFIVDESHRSVFGAMMGTIKTNFPTALYIGFTGTPILKSDNDSSDLNITTDVFGDEIPCRYSIADGIKDKNVLGFDMYKVLTFSDEKIREAVALSKAGIEKVEDVWGDEEKEKIYIKYTSPDIPMAGYYDDNKKYIKGIEDYLKELPSKKEYRSEKHRKAVVADIKAKWKRLSYNWKFHSILATSCIADAIEYYKLLKTDFPELKTAVLVNTQKAQNGDDSDDGNASSQNIKELTTILNDYNSRYKTSCTFETIKKDISLRLAHKGNYKTLEKHEELDMLIVVNQMLTGYDSKWLNTLYLDKELEGANIIQAFSRTNRLFGREKPFGTINYYKFPHTMQRKIEEAVKMYSGSKSFALFVSRFQENLCLFNAIYEEINALFKAEEIENYNKLPLTQASRSKFAKDFRLLSEKLETIKIQGFTWKQQRYGEFDNDPKFIDIKITEEIYNILLQRYKELFSTEPGGSSSGESPLYIEIDTDLINIYSGRIDENYMNERFEKYYIALQEGRDVEELIANLHRSFSSLSQEDQKYANLFLLDIKTGKVIVEQGKTCRDYITEYRLRFENDQKTKLCEKLGLDKGLLTSIMDSNVTPDNIRAFGRLDNLMKTLDTEKAQQYLESILNQKLNMFQVRMEAKKFVEDFILKGGFDIK